MGYPKEGKTGAIILQPVERELTLFGKCSLCGFTRTTSGKGDDIYRTGVDSYLQQEIAVNRAVSKAYDAALVRLMGQHQKHMPGCHGVLTGEDGQILR